MGATIAKKSYDVSIREKCTKRVCLSLPADLRDLNHLNKEQIYKLIQYYSICDFDYCENMFGKNLYNYRRDEFNRRMRELGLSTINNRNARLLSSQFPTLPSPY